MTRRRLPMALLLCMVAALALAGCTADRYDPENRDEVDTNGTDQGGPQPGGEPTGQGPSRELDDDQPINDGIYRT